MNNPIEPRRPISQAPIHPLAALTIIILDGLFLLPELAGPEVWIISSPLIAAAGFLSTLFVQRYLAKDGWGASVAKGLVMGILAGVPYAVTGTLAGIPLLVWAGLHEWVKLSPSKRNPQLPDEEHDVIDVEVKPKD